MESGDNFESSLKFTRNIVFSLCTIGFMLSAYAYHVETKKEKDESYQPVCDINEHVSCTVAFTSKYGKGFGILEHIVGKDSIFYQPNSVYGMTFYLLFVSIGGITHPAFGQMLIIAAILSNFCSVYLAYILYILRDICVVCVATYVINFGLLICSVYHYSLLTKAIEANQITPFPSFS